MSAFTLTQPQRQQQLLPVLNALTAHHRAACEPYDRILTALRVPHTPAADFHELTAMPVRMFKTHTLKSFKQPTYRTLTSSGTTGDVSRIYLDKAAAIAQARALVTTLGPVVGTNRPPMLIVDAQPREGDAMTARAAGAVGVSLLGSKRTYVLTEQGEPDIALLKTFLRLHGDAPFLIFGFTFMAWLYLYEVAAREKLDLSNGTLIHSGGWKKLIDRAVDNATFRLRFAEDTGLTQIYNFYGMVEQIGTVFLEGPEGGSLYAPDFAQVIIRDPETLDVAPIGKPGLVQVFSSLPTSYPGHVLLTEDLGVIDGIDDGPWPGPRLRILGRLPRAEVRGCSDTFTPASAA